MNVDLYVGDSADGTLAITGGGAVNSHYNYIGFASGSTGQVTVDGNGSTLNSSGNLFVGYGDYGTLAVTAGGNATSNDGHIGYEAGSTGLVSVDGTGSSWTNDNRLYVGYDGNAEISVTGGAAVTNVYSYIGGHFGCVADPTGHVTVDGVGSTWTTDATLFVGFSGDGTMDIMGGGLVSVSGLNIDFEAAGNSHVNMSTGGMLALAGEADGSLTEFLTLVTGTDDIRYWDDTLADWSPISNATRDVDYTLQHHTTGDLAGYTVLTVGTVPEPGACFLLVMGLTLATALSRRR